MENPIKMDDSGGPPLFLETPIFHIQLNKRLAFLGHVSFLLCFFSSFSFVSWVLGNASRFRDQVLVWTPGPWIMALIKSDLDWQWAYYRVLTTSNVLED